MLWTLLAVAYGQIYNPLDPRPSPPSEGATYSVSAGLDLDQGNTERLVVKGAVGASWIGARAESIAVLHGDSGWAGGETTTQNAFAHVRHNRLIVGPWRWVSFSQLSANPFKDLALRSLVGTGIEWRAYPTEGVHLAAATTVMAEHQVFEASVIDSDAGLHARNSTYVLLGLQVGDRSTTGFTAFLQPRVDEPANCRATADAFFKVDLSQPAEDAVGIRPRGNLQVSTGIDWDSQPPPDVAPLDATVDVMLGVTWK